jgi:uncharacterized protein (TIRG00374 family)
VKHRYQRVAARLVGLALIALVVWLVGWGDRVTDPDGVEHRGRIVERTETSVTLESDQGREVVPIDDARKVREGLATVLGRFVRTPGPALLGLLLHALAVLCTFVRWGILLNGADLATPWSQVLRLSLIGQFTASFLPGGNTGGDLVRALYVARTHSHRKTRSVVTIFADRIIGLAVLSAIATVSLLFAPAGSRIGEARGTLLVIFAILAAVVLILFSNRLRRWLHLQRLFALLPFQHIVDEIHLAIDIYASRRRILLLAVATTVVGHALTLTAFFCYGRALGVTLTPMAVGVAIPVSMMIASIPLLPGGWGAGEFAFYFFLPPTGVPAGVAVALSITQRILHTMLSLPGGFLLSRTVQEDPLAATVTDVGHKG